MRRKGKGMGWLEIGGNDVGWREGKDGMRGREVVLGVIGGGLLNMVNQPLHIYTKRHFSYNLIPWNPAHLQFELIIIPYEIHPQRSDFHHCLKSRKHHHINDQSRPGRRYLSQTARQIKIPEVQNCAGRSLGKDEGWFPEREEWETQGCWGTH